MNRPRLALIAAACAAVACAASSTASANNLFTLDRTPASPARVIQDAFGTAYIGWVHDDASNDGHALFCKIPRGGTCSAPIQLPAPAGSPGFSPVDSLPVFGGGTTVYVVVPSQATNELALYKSTDGGTTFGSPTVMLYAAHETDPSTLIRAADGSLMLSASNPALGFNSFTETGTSAGFEFTGEGAPSSPELDGSSLAIDSAGNPLESFWLNPASGPYRIGFYRYKGIGTLTDQAAWSGPFPVANGYEAKLSFGASGVFMVSQDYAGGANPSAVDVRKYNGTSFDSPARLANDSDIDLFAGGAIAQSPSGRLEVAWPGHRAGDNEFVMRLYTSTNGGASFGAETDVAKLADDYGVNDNAQLAIGDDGSGWLTYSTVGGGLQVADLTPIAPYKPPPPGPPPAYDGPYATHTVTVQRGLAVTARAPSRCLLRGQRFHVSLASIVKQKLARGARLAILSASASLDGHRLATLRRRPFVFTLKAPAAASRSKHTIAVLVKLRVSRKHHRAKTVTRTLRLTLSIC
jgi:hypothetical protein